jgi:ribosomal protein S12 methylthiotransferase
MIASLEARGFSWCENPDTAEIIIVNTCGFVHDAKKESIETTLLFREKYPDKTIVMAGCLSERYGSELAAELGDIDGFTGLSGPRDIVDTVVRALASREPGGEPPRIERAATEASEMPRSARTRLLSYPGSAYVKIAEGCDNRCSYCAIPIIRGGLVSRDVDGIVTEIAGLSSRGIRELNLVAQDGGSFGFDRGGRDLPGLLRAIAKIDADFWVRILYIHPDHFPEEILAIMKDDPRFLPYFDIPFQHAARPVLARMGRKGDAGIYLSLLERIRNVLPDAVLRSTFLVGFPGETEEDVAVLADFQERARLDWAGVFRFSREEGTAAWSYPHRVPKGLGEKRKRSIEQAQVPITEGMLDRFVGRVIRVLVEERVEGEPFVLGRGFMHAPEIDGLVVVHPGEGGGPLEPGSFVSVRLAKRNGFDLEGMTG